MDFVIEDDDDDGGYGGRYADAGGSENPYDMIDLSDDLTSAPSSTAARGTKSTKSRRSDTAATKAGKGNASTKARKRGSKGAKDGTDDVLAEIMGEPQDVSALKERRRATWASRLSAARAEPQPAAKPAPAPISTSAATSSYRDTPLSPSAAARGRVVMGVDSLRDMLGPDINTAAFGTAAPRAPVAPTPSLAPAPVAAPAPAPVPAPAAAPAPQRGAVQFPVGTRIHARFGGSDWFPGVIAAIHWLRPSGAQASSLTLEPAYDVQYDDGEVEEAVHASHIRLEPPPARDLHARFANADSPPVAQHIAAAVEADETSYASVPEEVAAPAPVAPARVASPSTTSSPRYDDNFESDNSYREAAHVRPALPRNATAPAPVAPPQQQGDDIPEDEDYAPDFDASASAAQLLAPAAALKRERSNSLGRPQSAGRRPRSAASVNVAWQEAPRVAAPAVTAAVTAAPHAAVQRIVVRDAEVQTEPMAAYQPPMYAPPGWGTPAPHAWGMPPTPAAAWAMPPPPQPAPAAWPGYAYAGYPQQQPSLGHPHADIAASVQRFLRSSTGDASPAATAAYLRAFADSLSGAVPPAAPAYMPPPAYPSAFPPPMPPAMMPGATMGGDVQPAVARALAQYREALFESDVMFHKQLELLRETVMRDRMRSRGGAQTPLGTLNANTFGGAQTRATAEYVPSLASSFASADTRATMTGGGGRTTYEPAPGLAETREYVAAHRRREMTIEEARERVRLQEVELVEERDSFRSGGGQTLRVAATGPMR